MFTLDEILSVEQYQKPEIIVLLGRGGLRDGIKEWNRLLKQPDIFQMIEECYPNEVEEMAKVIGLDRIISERITPLMKYIKLFEINECNYIRAIESGDVFIYCEIRKHYEPTPTEYHVLVAVRSGNVDILSFVGMGLSSIGRYTALIISLRKDQYNKRMIEKIISGMERFPYPLFKLTAVNMKIHDDFNSIIRLLYTYIELEGKSPNLLFLRHVKTPQ